MWKILITIYMACVASLAAAGEPAPAARDSLLREIRAWVAGQAGVAAERVEIAPPDGRLRIVPCAAGAKLDFPFPARDLVRARCDAPAWQVFIRVSVLAPKNIVVAARALAAGRVLSEADLSLREAPAPVTEAFEDRSAVVGRITKRELPQGSPILARDLDESVGVIRMVQSLKAGAALASGSYRIETVPRAAAPPGAAAGVVAVEGTQVIRDVAAGRILLADEVSEVHRVLVARQSLVAGSILEPGMFEVGPVTSRDKTQRYFGEFGNLGGNELARNLQAGEPLRAGDLRPALLVRRGQIVLLTVGSPGGVQVTVRTEAQQDGRMGETVQLKNPESGRVLSGVVSGRNAARGI